MRPSITLIDDSILNEARRRAEAAVRRAIAAGATIDQGSRVFTQVFWQAVDELTQSEEPPQGETA